MNVTNLFDQLHDPYADHDDAVTAKRAELLTHLTYGIRVMEHAAELLDDATFDGDAVRRIVVPLLGDSARIARMAAAAESAGTRTGTENVITLIDRALVAA